MPLPPAEVAAVAALGAPQPPSGLAASLARVSSRAERGAAEERNGPATWRADEALAGHMDASSDAGSEYSLDDSEWSV